MNLGNWNLCTCDSEEREHGEGAGLTATMVSERIGIISLSESVAREFRLGKILCGSDSEEHGCVCVLYNIQTHEKVRYRSVWTDQILKLFSMNR